MTTSAQIIADSISEQGIRLRTFKVRLPTIVWNEVLTHRMLSRNASSSRAIPAYRMIADVERDPFIPTYWGKNQPGMQAREELTGWELDRAKDTWFCATSKALYEARLMASGGVHKQLVNRILMPYSHTDAIITATDLDNFYALRRHEDAQPEIHELADAMWEAQEASTPRLLKPGEWHLPFVTEDDWYWLRFNGNSSEVISRLIKLSVARVARVSYNNHDGSVPSVEKDTALHDRLLTDKHMSPFEHQATPNRLNKRGKWSRPQWHGNFTGYCQYRKQIENEAVRG